MIPKRYFPFRSPQYSMQIGAQPLRADEGILEPDELREEELALKRACMEYDPDYYCRALPGSEAMIEETARVLGMEPGMGLRAMGDSVQEDLLILSVGEEGVPLVAGHLCFPNAWSLGDKIGRSFLEIHGPVPGFGTGIGPPSQKLLERLKGGRPVQRINWAVKATGQLDLTMRWAEWEAEQKRLVTAENAGERCYLRIERQTLTALPESQGVLFGLHTYVQRIDSLDGEERMLVKGVLRTCPEAMLAYKGITPYHEPLLAWLSAGR